MRSGQELYALCWNKFFSTKTQITINIHLCVISSCFRIVPVHIFNRHRQPSNHSVPNPSAPPASVRLLLFFLFLIFFHLNRNLYTKIASEQRITHPMAVWRLWRSPSTWRFSFFTYFGNSSLRPSAPNSPPAIEFLQQNSQIRVWELSVKFPALTKTN